MNWNLKFVFTKKESEDTQKIQLEHLIIPYIILGVGLVVGLVVFLFEKLVERQVTAQAKNNLESISVEGLAEGNDKHEKVDE